MGYYNKVSLRDVCAFHKKNLCWPVQLMKSDIGDMILTDVDVSEAF